MRIRAFLALVFSVGVTRRLADEVAGRKGRVADAGLRVAWVPAANLHLTLKFLGSVPEESLEAIAAAVGRVAARHAPFEARARGLGAFPSAAHPRILWAGVDGGEALKRLQADVEGALAELGFAKEERAFHPHVTVGRVKEQKGALDGAAWASDAEWGVSQMSEIVLYESRTLRAGAEYVARARVPIGKKET
jgi:2'-5' RNA ligase